MPRYTRTTRRTRRPRIVRKRRTTRKAPLTKMVRRVAAQQVLRMSETKRIALLNETWSLTPTTPSGSQYSIANIFSVVQQNQNATGGGMVGDTILRPLFVAKMRALVNWDRVRQLNGGGTGSTSVTLHAWIVASNDQLVLGTPASVNPYDAGSSGPQWFYNTDAFSATLNGDNVKVLKHWSRTIHPPSIVSGTGSTALATVTAIRHKFVLKFKGQKEFEGRIPSTTQPGALQPWLKGWNYYLLIGGGTPTGYPLTGSPLAPLWDIYVDRYLYFKDF
ncbi:MAG: capsid protein [Wigfec virus K19_486]|nr:MAG: capsid protein [Wigfec virus K19_486]